MPVARAGPGAGRRWAAASARTLYRRLRREAAAARAAARRPWPNPDAAEFAPRVRFATPPAHFGQPLFEPGFTGPVVSALRSSAPPFVPAADVYCELTSTGACPDLMVGVAALTGVLGGATGQQCICTSSYTPLAVADDVENTSGVVPCTSVAVCGADQARGDFSTSGQQQCEVVLAWLLNRDRLEIPDRDQLETQAQAHESARNRNQPISRAQALGPAEAGAERAIGEAEGCTSLVGAVVCTDAAIGATGSQRIGVHPSSPSSGVNASLASTGGCAAMEVESTTGVAPCLSGTVAGREDRLAGQELVRDCDQLVAQEQEPARRRGCYSRELERSAMPTVDWVIAPLWSGWLSGWVGRFRSWWREDAGTHVPEAGLAGLASTLRSCRRGHYMYDGRCTIDYVCDRCGADIVEGSALIVCPPCDDCLCRLCWQPRLPPVPSDSSDSSESDEDVDGVSCAGRGASRDADAVDGSVSYAQDLPTSLHGLSSDSDDDDDDIRDLAAARDWAAKLRRD